MEKNAGRRSKDEERLISAIGIERGGEIEEVKGEEEEGLLGSCEQKKTRELTQINKKKTKGPRPVLLILKTKGISVERGGAEEREGTK